MRVKHSRLTATGDLQISTGTEGRTRVKHNDAAIEGSVEVSTGDDGTCRSRRNTPELPCGVADTPVDPGPGDDGL